MLNFTQGSKYQAETISIVLDFSDQLSPGDTITSIPVITVTIATGFDSSPSDILYQGCEVRAGTIIEQRFRLGVIGTIYHILFTVATVAGDILDKECYLAILPDDDSAVPNWLPLWETTQLYPYQVGPEGIETGIAWASGTLRVTLYHIPPEGTTSHSDWTGGTLIIIGVSYAIPHEDIQSGIGWDSGTLIIVSVLYDVPHEDIRSGLAWISGTLVNAGIGYIIPHEDIQSSITWTGGTLI